MAALTAALFEDEARATTARTARTKTKSERARERARLQAARDSHDLREMGFTPISANQRQRALKQEVGRASKAQKRAGRRRIKPGKVMTTKELRSYQRRQRERLQREAVKRA